MKNLSRNIITTLLTIVPMVSIASEKPDFGNIRVVIGSKSTGGDTYQAASIITQALSEKLGINAKVDAVGTIPGYSILQRDKGGHTIMVTHDQSYIGTLYGTKGYVDMFENFKMGPIFATNPANAYLVPKSSKFKTLENVIDAAGNGEKVTVAIQPGSVSEIGYSAIRNAVKIKYPGMEENLVAVNTGSQEAKNQLLFDGLADVIHGSLPANEQYTHFPETDQKAMRFLWLTAKKSTIDTINTNGFGKLSKEEINSYAEPMVTVPIDEQANFTFDKEFFILYSKNTPNDKIAYIDKALKEIYSENKIKNTMEKAFFVPNFKTSVDALKYMELKKEQYKKIVDNIKN